ncbi:MAG: glycosyltransferase involved in cell wall biosynthesis [Planctomycetota bacterium]|jgi:glycosyltransferase involved in cell wall biosynthesis
MKILYIVHDFLPRHRAGTEVYTAQLALRVQERGHQVRIFATEKDISRPHLQVGSREWEGLQVSELVNNLFYGSFEETWDWPPAVEAFGRICDEFQPDVVHVMHLLYQSIGVVEEAERRGIPVVYTLHDFWLQCARFGQRIHADGSVCHTMDHGRCGTCLATFKFAQSTTQRRAAKAIAGLKRTTGVDLGPSVLRMTQRGQATGSEDDAGEYRFDEALAEQRAEQAAARDRDLLGRVVPNVARFFAPSLFLRDALVTWGIPEERIEHLRYGLEQAPFENFERRPSDKVRVRYLGTLAPHKAPHLVLEAWGRLPEELRAKGNLIIHGPKESQPDYVAKLEALAAKVGAELPGAVERSDIPAVLADTDLLVVPSIWYENSPLTIHEARSTRTPLLVSDLGGMAELVEPGREGWRFRVGDAGDIAARLEKILKDPDCLARLPFDGPPVKPMVRSAEEMEARYQEVLSAKGGDTSQ